MQLGTFSVSLAVKDLQASKNFYQKFGFEVTHGEEAQNWLILKNGSTIIGLFQDMLDKNTLTFNPGWDMEGKELESYTDIRDIQKQLKSQGIEFIIEADEYTSGPAHFIVADPDGNPIMVDQHV